MAQINIENKKSFWKRPEGIPGAIVLIGIIGALIYGANMIMPTLIELAENIWYLAAMCGGLFILAYMLFDSKVRTLIWYFYKSMIRKATGIFIQLDPIAIIEGYVEDLRDKMKSMEDSIASLKGQIRIIKEKVKVREKEYNTSMALAREAGNQGLEGKQAIELKKAGRIQEAIVSYNTLDAKMGKLYTVLDKMKNYSGLMIEDISHEVEMKKDERKMIQTSHSVMKSAVNIINGNSDKKMLFDQAMEFIVDDIGMRIGEMERFMDVSADFMQTVDLENAMYHTEGLAALEEWSKKADEKFHVYHSPIKTPGTQPTQVLEREKVAITSTQDNSSNVKNKYL